MPHQSSVAIPWRLKKHRYMFLGTKCVCGLVHYPPRKHCTSCGSDKLANAPLPRNGVIVSFTKISVPPDGFKAAVPYFVGLIQLDNGVTISSHVVGEGEKIKIGAPVRAVFRSFYKHGESGVINYTTKFEVV